MSAPGAPCGLVRSRLRRRGFRDLTLEEACRVGPWMRFTPALQALLFGLCTVTGSVPVLLGLAAVLAIGLVSRHHPFDWIYGVVIRPLERTPALPPSPARRRMVFALGIAWCLATAAAFAQGPAALGYVLGALMTASTTLLAMTHICVPSLVLARVAGCFPGSRG